jgi:hypothetical protein
MRIVKPIEECKDLANHAEWVTKNTTEITDAELDTIVRSWRNYLSQHRLTIKDYPFSLHFRISIARTGEGK